MSRVLLLVVALLLAAGCANTPACEDLLGTPTIGCGEGVPVCLLPNGDIAGAEYYPNGELASADRPFCLGENGGPRCNAVIVGDELIEPSPACVDPLP